VSTAHDDFWDEDVPEPPEFLDDIPAVPDDRPLRAVPTPPQAQPGDTWKPVNLAEIVAAGYDRPRPDLCAVDGIDIGLFYPGRINSLFGDSGGGKTWVGDYCVAETIRSGRDAVIIDYEDHPSSTLDRLQMLGLTVDQIVKHLIYINPMERWTPAAKGALESAIFGRNIVFALFDSTGEGMALDGVDPNRDDQVARWFQGAARLLAHTGACVLLLDHVVKTQQNGRNVDFASGSQRKRAAINGAAYYLEVVVAPSRDNDGKLKLITRKCRFGWRKHGTVACIIDIRNNDEDSGVDMSFSVPEDGQDTGPKRYTWYMERISRFLEEEGATSFTALRKANLGKNGGKAATKYIEVAVKSLRDEGFITSEAGQPLVLGKAYRVESDPIVNPHLRPPEPDVVAAEFQPGDPDPF
jgi:hypothetical protein